MRQLLRLSALVLVGVIISSCSEVIIKDVPETHTWSLDSAFTGYNKFLLASLKIDESTLLVANSNSIWEVNLPDVHLKYIEGSIILQQSSLSYDPPSLHKTMSVSVIDNDHLLIFPTLCPACVDDVVTITSDPYSGPSYSLKGFQQADMVYGTNSGGYPVTEDGYILAPHELEMNQESGQATFLLIKIDTLPARIPQDPSPQLKLNSVKSISLSHGFSLGAGARYFSASYYDKFFLSLYGGFFVIDKTGFVRKINLNGPGPSRMFVLESILFAMNGQRLFQSHDQGETWTVFSDDIGQFANAYYFNVGDDLYIALQDQLARATLKENTINFVELDNDGLETNIITSINKCGPYAFVTTLAGLYYRDTTGFNAPKNP